MKDSRDKDVKGAKMMSEIPGLLQEDLRMLLLIRHFENLLLELFAKGAVKGTTHTCLGQEYIPVSISACLKDTDFVLSNHRCHGHYLARFNDPRGLLAEILGKEGAVCNGVGGSQHIHREGFLSTGIQGENVGVSLGIGLHYKNSASGNLVVVYIGDGTWGQGIVYEALNIMSLLNLPIVLVVENNRIAQSTPIEKNMAGTIQDRTKAFGISYLKVAGCDIKNIRDMVGPVLDRIRQNSHPSVIEFDTFRLGPHSASKDGRSDEELAFLRQHDWYGSLRNLNSNYFDAIEANVKEEMRMIYQDIERAPLVF